MKRLLSIVAALVVALSLVLVPATPALADPGTTIDKQVSNAANDGDYATNCSFWNTEANFIPAIGQGDGTDGTRHGFGFIDLGEDDIPEGATITTFYIEWEKYWAAGTALTKVYLNDTGSPVTPTSCADALGKAQTAGIDWDGAWDAGWNESPELKTILQPLVTAGTVTAILVLHEDDGSGAYNYNSPYRYNYDNNLHGMKIHIEYTLGWTGEIEGIVNPAEVLGILVANIGKILGVE